MSSYAQFNPSFGGGIPCLLKWLLCSPTHSASQQKSDPIQRRQTTIAGPLASYCVPGLGDGSAVVDHGLHTPLPRFLPNVAGGLMSSMMQFLVQRDQEPTVTGGVNIYLVEVT